MKTRKPSFVWFGIVLMCSAFARTEGPAAEEGNTSSALDGASNMTAREPGPPVKNADTCADPELQPNSMSPTWNIQASTVQCGALETDNLATLQPLGGGVAQWTVGTTAKYGLAPRLEIRWGLPGRMYQGGGPRLAGTTDQWLAGLYRFHDQAGWAPDLALDYAFKIPTANPAKGFGSGYGDHLLTFIASRDLGPNHIDFNVVGTLAGEPGGYEGAAQLGMGLSRTFAHHLMGTIEAFGGPQPGTEDRYGAVFLGGSWGLRPQLALNGGWIRSYTAGSPREQFMFGFIYTIRPGLALPRESRLSRIFGR
jgi:hypothetical protein